jgi:hypothetical protein
MAASAKDAATFFLQRLNFSVQGADSSLRLEVAKQIQVNANPV